MHGHQGAVAARGCQDAQELAVMRRAAILAGRVMEEAIPLLKTGVREFEVAAEIEYQMRKRGASGAAFETIVVTSGTSPASADIMKLVEPWQWMTALIASLPVWAGLVCADTLPSAFTEDGSGGFEISMPGLRVLFVSGSNERFESYYNGRLFVAPASGGAARVMVGDTDGYDVDRAVWSKDGASIYFLANLGVHEELFVVPAAGRTAIISLGASF